MRGGLNLYGYANGDPVNFRDPTGLDPECLHRNELGVCTFWELDGVGNSGGDAPRRPYIPLTSYDPRPGRDLPRPTMSPRGLGGGGGQGTSRTTVRVVPELDPCLVGLGNLVLSGISEFGAIKGYKIARKGIAEGTKFLRRARVHLRRYYYDRGYLSHNRGAGTMTGGQAASVGGDIFFAAEDGSYSASDLVSLIPIVGTLDALGSAAGACL